LLHAGHVQYLDAARQLCDRLIVAVNSDESVRRYKNPFRPIHPEQQRMFVVAGLESVDAVVPMDEDPPLSLLLLWKPALYIQGGDCKSEELSYAEAVKAYGGDVRVIETEFGISTSATLERIEALMIHAAPERVEPVSSRGLVLLDRDGTLIRNIPFLSDPSKVE